VTVTFHFSAINQAEIRDLLDGGIFPYVLGQEPGCAVGEENTACVKCSFRWRPCEGGRVRRSGAIRRE